MSDRESVEDVDALLWSWPREERYQSGDGREKKYDERFAWLREKVSTQSRQEVCQEMIGERDRGCGRPERLWKRLAEERRESGDGRWRRTMKERPG